MAASELINCIVASPNLDILQLRSISRLGLPDSTSRIRVWPLLLGLSSQDLANDKKIYRAFTEVHNQGKQLSAIYDDEKRAYSALKRAWDARKKTHEEMCTSLETQNGESGAWEMEKDEIHEKLELEVVPFLEPAPSAPTSPEYPTTYWEQITKDVERSLWKQVPEEASRNLARDKLHRMICAVICTTKDDEGKPLHYFQGYHDITGVFLLACGEELGFSLLRRLSVTYLRDQMQEKIDYMLGLLKLLFPLVTVIDRNIGKFLEKSQVQPYSALPWVMTWYSHVLENQFLSERLFDLFLASPSWIPLYLASSLFVHMSANGLYSCPCESSEVHSFISRFCSRNDLPWEALIKDSLTYYELFPISSLHVLKYLPSDSYLIRYPYDWVPKNEVLADIGLRLSRPLKLSLISAGIVAASLAALGVSWYLNNARV